MVDPDNTTTLKKFFDNYDRVRLQVAPDIVILTLHVFDRVLWVRTTGWVAQSLELTLKLPSSIRIPRSGTQTISSLSMPPLYAFLFALPCLNVTDSMSLFFFCPIDAWFDYG
jgi:hypothetical protein